MPTSIQELKEKIGENGKEIKNNPNSKFFKVCFCIFINTLHLVKRNLSNYVVKMH